jgi:hypothetical protein
MTTTTTFDFELILNILKIATIFLNILLLLALLFHICGSRVRLQATQMQWFTHAG